MSTLSIKSIIEKSGWTLLCALLLMGAAFYNTFPLVTTDSGVYILSGFKKFVPLDRPIVYGMFVRHASLAASLWFTIFFQSLILSYVVWHAINSFANASVGRMGKVLIILILVFFTGISWYASQIMPDIFTSIGILALLLLLCTPGTLFRNIFLSIFLAGAALMHNSNLLQFSLLLLVILPVAIRSRLFRNGIIRWSRYILLISVITASWFIAPVINYMVDGEYRTTGTPHAFLVAKYIENGILDRYLRENCPSSLVTAIPDSGLYYIWARHSDKVLDIARASKEEGAIVHQWGFVGSLNQQFYIVKVAPEYYKIISKNSLKCIEVALKDTGTKGMPMVQGNFTGSDNQLFSFASLDGSDKWFIRNKQTGKEIDIARVSKDDGAEATQWTHTGGTNQQFVIVKYPDCLCVFKDSLPSSAVTFLWTPNGYFQKTGGWYHSREEYSKIMNKILLSPKYLSANIGAALLGTIQQLTMIDMGDNFGGYDKDSSPGAAIDKYLNNELKPFLNSKQNKWVLVLKENNSRLFLLNIFSLFVLICFFGIRWLRRSVGTLFSYFILFTLLGILCNAFVTGALANVLERLECRVIWLVPMLALILVANYFVPAIRKYVSEKGVGL